MYIFGFPGRGPTATYILNENHFCIVKHGKNTGVWSCDFAYNKEFLHILIIEDFVYYSLVIKL